MTNSNKGKITMESGKLQVPNQPIIPYIQGDGIGPEIWSVTEKVLDSAVAKAYKGKRAISWMPVLAGQSAFDVTGNWLPEATINALKDYLVAIKGPLTTPIGEGHRSLNVTLRQALDLYTCFRPVKYYPGISSPVCHPEKVNMFIFRENTEDIYAGLEFKPHQVNTVKLIDLLATNQQIQQVRFPETSAFAIKPISKQGSKRLVKAAIDYAIIHDEKKVTLVHKGNIMKATEGSFKTWGYEVANTYGNQVFSMEEYASIEKELGRARAEEALKKAKQQGAVIVNDMITDNFFQQSLLHPEQFAVIATMNLTGDYISDALAAQVGGIGIAPGGNLNYQTGHALFEATHGSAPNFTGQNRVNPTSLILSGKMLLDYLNWSEAADLIEAAITKAIQFQFVTEDLALSEKSKILGTSEFGAYIVQLIQED